MEWVWGLSFYFLEELVWQTSYKYESDTNKVRQEFHSSDYRKTFTVNGNEHDFSVTSWWLQVVRIMSVQNNLVVVDKGQRHHARS